MNLKTPGYLTQEAYTKIFAEHETYLIFKGMIQSRNLIRFYLKENDYLLREGLEGEAIDPFFDAEHRDSFAVFSREKLSNGLHFSWSARWEGWEYLRTVVTQFPKNQLVGIDREGQVMRWGAGDSEIEEKVGDMVFDVTEIGGYAYFVGHNKIWKRQNVSDYQLVYDGKAKGVYFMRIAGLSENDFYVATDKGALLHFNGETLRKTTFDSTIFAEKVVHQAPTIYSNNLEYEQITCLAPLPNGEVYFGTGMGRVFRKNGDTWQQLTVSEPENLVYPIRNIVLFQNRVFLVSGFWNRYRVLSRYDKKHVWEIKENTVKIADLPDMVHDFAETLDAKDGVMLVAGKRGAVLWDGTDWEVLIDRQRFE